VIFVLATIYFLVDYVREARASQRLERVSFQPG
jgi:hypothetical protein